MNPGDPKPLVRSDSREIDIALDEIDSLERRQRDQVRYIAAMGVVDFGFAWLLLDRWMSDGLSGSSLIVALCLFLATLAGVGGLLSTRRQLAAWRGDVDHRLRESDA